MSDPTQITGNAKVPSDVYGSSIDNIYVNGTDSIEVDAGGTATNISAAGGNGFVYGGTASNWTANSGGYIAVDSGATLSGLTVDGGYVDVNNGATVDTATVSNPSNLDGKGYLIINSGTVNGGTATSGGMIDAKGINAVASGVTASSGGKLLAEQGTLLSATVGSGGNFTLNGSPASATNTVVNGGELDVNSGAKVTTTTVDSGGKVSAAGAMSTTTVNDGTVTILGGGSADATTVNNTGEFYVLSNANVTSTTVNAGGDMSAWGGVTSTTLNDGKLTVLDGGTAETTIVSGKSASLYVDSNGSAFNNTIDGGSVFVEGLVSGGTLTDGGQIRVSAGGIISGINTTDGSLWVYAGASAVDTNVNSGFTEVDGNFSGGSIYDGKIQVNSGGVASGVFASGTNFDTQGTIEVNGGTVIDPITHDFGNVTLNTGTVENLSATGGGITMNGGTLSGGTFQSGATMTVSAGAVNGVATIGNGGHANVSGGTVSDLNIETGGSGAITGGSVADATVSSGGTLNFDTGATLTDKLTLSSGGTATITGNTGGTVQLGDGYTSGLTITDISTSSSSNVGTTINGWTKDSQIDLKFVTNDHATWAYSGADSVKITLGNGTVVTLNIPGVEAAGFDMINDGQGGTIITCFLPGSMIRTSTGVVAAEDIQIGDQVVTFDWKNNQDVTRAVIWAGKAHCTVRPELSDDAAGWPVRILKDAIAD
ncbi:Hint domain-containing protein, partial [Acetobacter malorum]|uniref:Hint domain-containing protein n=1 Tax=Acetobacter malorum TaxID=178901 RepID=UPI0022311556